MKIYQVDGVCHAEVAGGGYQHQDRLQAEPEVRTFPTKPAPAGKWSSGWKPCAYGRDCTTWTRWAAGDVVFTTRWYEFSGTDGNSAQGAWETFLDDNPPVPVLGESYLWTGADWQPIPHPMAVA